MKLLHLQYFKKVFETQNVTQAAKDLFISQPALSRAIKHLESELGVPLFYHSGRNIEPTIYARVLPLRCQDISHFRRRDQIDFFCE